MLKLALIFCLVACSRGDSSKSPAPAAAQPAAAQPPPGAPVAAGDDSREARKAGLKRYALHMCDSFPALAPPECKAQVAERFEGCVDPMLVDRRKNAGTFAACLGFKTPN